jgi:4'-phosphopantetheinyl transferase EntD
VAPTRVQEFAAGLICARRARADFGSFDRALPIGSDRRPVWPHHMVGCITHTTGFCGAVVGEALRYASLGLDAEVIGRVTPELWPIVCTDIEAAWLAGLPLLERAQVGTLIFCIKEAFYKCQYGMTGEWLEFRDITVDLAGWDLGTGIFAVRPLKPVRLLEQQPLPWIGRFHFSADFAFAGMAFPRRSE